MFLSHLAVEGETPHGDDPELDVWRERLGVACRKQEYLRAITEAGFRDVEVGERPYTGPGMVSPLEGKIVRLQIRAHK